MNCKKCDNNDISAMTLIANGPHTELICDKCLAHIKFISKKNAAKFRQLQEKYNLNKNKEK